MTDEGSAPRKTRLYGAIDPRELHSLEGPPTVADSQTYATVAAPSEGERLARYEVREVLGRGGMGEVLSVRDDQIGRFVALKRLRVEHPPDPLVARFLREARIQGRLEHRPRSMGASALRRRGCTKPRRSRQARTRWSSLRYLLRSTAVPTLDDRSPNPVAARLKK